MILGIDYGRAKIGLARADSSLAEPWQVIRVNSFEDALGKIEAIAESGDIEKIVIGISEGQMGKEQEEFAARLSNMVSVQVETWDEGLSTHDAQKLAVASGRGPKKRREMEDAYAATLVLQSFLDGRQESSRSD